MSENKKRPNAEFIIAFAEGKQLQFLSLITKEWIDFQGEHDDEPDAGPWNSGDHIQWRIKPEQQWVRVAQFKGLSREWTDVCFNAEAESTFEICETFSHWRSDRLYYTPKERP